MKQMIGFLLLFLLAGSHKGLGAAPAQPTSTNGAAPAKPSSKVSDLFADTVVAKGKGVEIKRSQLDEEIIRTKAGYAAQQRQAPPDLDQRVLDGLIGAKLILSRATDAEFNEKLGPSLRMQGLKREQWDKQQLEQATIPAVLEREMKINVTDDEVKKYYDENPARFEEPEMVRASHILLSTRDMSTDPPKELPEDKKKEKRKQIDDLLKRARGGEDFAKLAKEFSEDPDSKDKGGEYTFARGRMVPEFEAAAFSLSTNQISDVVTTQYGYHIIKLSEKIPAKKTELAKISPRIKDFLKSQAVQTQIKGYLENLKKEAGVEILDEKLKLSESASSSGLPPGHPVVKPATKP